MTTALIAEDEPLLAQALRDELQAAWPALEIVAIATDGDEAVEQAMALRPDLLFLDIRMPGRSGLEAAEAIVEDWPAAAADGGAADAPPLPLIVFVTAYDHYALQAFERAAVDYLQKPVQPARLAACCSRLRGLLAPRAAASPARPGSEDAELLARLRSLLAPATAGPAPTPLRVIQASVGNTLHMLPLDEVVYFEAADKYLRVLTAEREALIRTSMRDLLPQLPADRFWQIHRGTVVRADAIATAVRDESGKLRLTLRERPERLTVSRLYAHRFRGM